MFVVLSAVSIALSTPPTPIPGLGSVAHIDDDLSGATLVQGWRVEARGERRVVDRARVTLRPEPTTTLHHADGSFLR